MARKGCSFIPLIPYEEITIPVKWERYFDLKKPVVVEIGFGMGEFLVESAAKHTNTNFIGVEKNWERIYKTLKRIMRLKAHEGQQLDNIKILKLDAWLVFERLLPQSSIDKIHCLFPCPWPKKAHVKNRLFSTRFLEILNSRLKNHGSLEIVTDHHPYFKWIQEQAQQQDLGFEKKTSTIRPSYGTKFEKKWVEEGKKEFYKIRFVKTRDTKVKQPKETVLKSYYVKNFEPSRFKFINVSNGCSIVFKDMLYDKEKQHALIQLVVAEQHLTQHFRVVISKKGKQWCICKARGQIFFPTPGIAKALEAVYASVLKTS